jgi:hypothetical protein
MLAPILGTGDEQRRRARENAVTEPAIPSVDVHVGDVSHSQLVFGDHNTIQTPKGTKVTVLQVGDRPVARLRAMPVASRPTARVEIVGRDEQLRLAASATSDAPVQLYAPGGAGKTALLQSVAQETATPPEGVVFAAVRRRTLDDIQAKLYTAFWESDVPFLPGPAEVGGFLADREALLVLDDCGLDRDDLDALLDSVGRCTVVTASGERTLWSRGTARALKGLDPAAALTVLERELGHVGGAEERAAAEAVVARLNGHPQSLVETAALIADGRASLRELADDPAALARRTDPSALSSSQTRILEVLAALGSAPLGVEHVSALADVPDAARELPALERRGWVKSASPRYRLVRPLPDGFAPLPEKELAHSLLGHLTGWSREAEPSGVADETEAVEALLDRAAGAQDWEGALALARAAEGKLAVAGSWTGWRNVLTSGLTAARALGDQAEEGYLLHQLGSRSLCLGADEMAVTQLEEALGIRERLGDHDGAELTRHNLGQIGGGGPGYGAGGGDGGGPWRPRLGVVLAALAAVAAAIIAVVLATSGGGSTNAVPAGQTGKAAPAATGASTPATTTPRRTGTPPSRPGASVGVAARISPPSVSFPTVPPDTENPPSEPITATNPGPQSITLGRVAIAGRDPGDFKVTDNCSRQRLGPQQHCTVTVTFRPSDVGGRTATLDLSDVGDGNPQTVDLSGCGGDPIEPPSSCTATVSPKVNTNSIPSSGTISGPAPTTSTQDGSG